MKKSHNVSCVIYHIVCPVKYRKKAINQYVAQTVKYVCVEIQKRYEIHYIEIGIDEDHVHFLVQSVPNLSPREIVQITKSIIARTVFAEHPEVKAELWGGQFWTSGYYVNTVGKHGNENIISHYVKNQGYTYRQIHRDQLTLFN
jgi:putative transposase